MNQMMNKSRSYNQQQLKLMCDNLCDNIEILLDTFDLEYKENNKMYTMSCPIHGGDNASALNLYHVGDNYRGNWACRTHGCEKIFKPSIIGFVRGLLSVDKCGWKNDGDQIYSFNDTVEFILQLLNKNLKDFKVNKRTQEKNRFSQIVEKISKRTNKTISGIGRQYVTAALNIPAQYYINRGYSSDILIKYDIGLCQNSNKEMSERIVAPIYDDEYRFVIGCTGRSIFDKCINCATFHNPTHDCPKEIDLWKYSKWKHSQGFKANNHLYNFWFAKDHILKTGTAIIVESPGNVWRLEENNIHNSVAIFGCSLSDRQKIILDASGAMNLIILTDNDDAGRSAAEQIKQKCQKTYRVYIPQISKSDIAEMNSLEIETEIKSYMEKLL